MSWRGVLLVAIDIVLLAGSFVAVRVGYRAYRRTGKDEYWVVPALLLALAAGGQVAYVVRRPPAAEATLSDALGFLGFALWVLGVVQFLMLVSRETTRR